jgi:excinuclease ABC subunit C
MNPILQEKLSNLPLDPGVYLYKDSKGQLIYVGKAKKIRNLNASDNLII